MVENTSFGTEFGKARKKNVGLDTCLTNFKELSFEVGRSFIVYNFQL